ncbi:MFS transporter [Mucilaginibacter hurinus]|nr:MFS transporter [Mucilaginibacter hurinus]
MTSKKNLWILAVIAVINSMGFGIVVPLLYSYGKRFGLTGETLGLLTAAFSIAQFFATPLLGSLSDKWGRKPVLIISLIGTCASFILFAQAQSLIILFAARILDGVTSGNISVAQAMISDISSKEDRAKNFGILSSAFGFSFVAGPAIGGLLSQYGLHMPFYFAAAIALVGVLLTTFLLKETNQNKQGKSLHHFSFISLITILKKPVVGLSVLVSFILTMAQFAMIIGFQTFTADQFKLTPTQTGLFYAGFGITGIITQLLVPFITRAFKSKSIVLMLSTLVCLGAMAICGLVSGLVIFAIALGVYGLFNGLRNPMLNAIIADNTDEKEQGEVLGINQSYISIGQTLGPITAGFVVAISLHSIFFLASLYILIAFVLSVRLKSKETKSS